MIRRRCRVCGVDLENFRWYYQGKRGLECPDCCERSFGTTQAPRSPGVPKVVDFAVYRRRREVRAYCGA